MSAFRPNDTSIAVLFLGFHCCWFKLPKLSKLNGKYQGQTEVQQFVGPIKGNIPRKHDGLKSTSRVLGSEVEVNLTILCPYLSKPRKDIYFPQSIYSYNYSYIPNGLDNYGR